MAGVLNCLWLVSLSFLRVEAVKQQCEETTGCLSTQTLETHKGGTPSLTLPSNTTILIGVYFHDRPGLPKLIGTGNYEHLNCWGEPTISLVKGKFTVQNATAEGYYTIVEMMHRTCLLQIFVTFADPPLPSAVTPTSNVTVPVTPVFIYIISIFILKDCF